MTSP
jgi:hypothetical protein